MIQKKAEKILDVLECIEDLLDRNLPGRKDRLVDECVFSDSEDLGEERIEG